MVHENSNKMCKVAIIHLNLIFISRNHLSLFFSLRADIYCSTTSDAGFYFIFKTLKISQQNTFFWWTFYNLLLLICQSVKELKMKKKRKKEIHDFIYWKKVFICTQQRWFFLQFTTPKRWARLHFSCVIVVNMKIN
jgi:hypothetical protein